ncbi:MAG: tetratricopeptide repeat protein, partial [Selenomonadaceae bacterium]|nr:tetratricopeptide repeat protein [Selenomonadaceae bacterium]
HGKKGNLNRALEDCNKAIQLDPKDSSYYIARANLYKSSFKDYDKALADYTTAIKLNPKDVDAYKARVKFYESHKKYSEAINDHKTILKLTPEKIDGYDYIEIGDMYKELKDYPNALEYYTKAINLELEYEHSDHRVTAYLDRALIYEEQGEHDKAIADCDKGIELAKAASGKVNATGVDSLLKDIYDTLISLLEQTKYIALRQATC